VKVTGRLSSNTADILPTWAIDGHGILLSARWDVADKLADGSLVRAACLR
jgi:LysR family transcriptional activator of dmlA